MTRRNAAWLTAAAGVLAVVLVGLYLATRRRDLTDLTPAAAGDLRVLGHTDPDATAEVTPAEATAPLPVSVAAATVAAAAAVVAAAPVPAAPPAEAAQQQVGDSEAPLPAWVRVAIVGAALIAFFAVSLIATKGV